MTFEDFFAEYEQVAVPHEVLGLAPEQRDPRHILDASRRRLQSVVEQTSEAQERAMLCRIIRNACTRMLATVAVAADGTDRANTRPNGDAMSWSEPDGRIGPTSGTVCQACEA